VIGHYPGFGSSGRTIVMRGVTQFHAGQVGDKRLELEDRLQCTLRDLRLVGGISREEFSTADQRVDCGWNIMPVSARAEKTHHIARGFIGGGKIFQFIQHFHFGQAVWKFKFRKAVFFGYTLE